MRRQLQTLCSRKPEIAQYAVNGKSWLKATMMLFLVWTLSACGDDPIKSQTTLNPIVDVRLQGEPGAPITHLRVPAAYLDRRVGWWQPHILTPKAERNAVQTSRDALLFMEWPGLAHVNKNNIKKFEDIRGPSIKVLISANDPSRIDLDEQMRLILSSLERDVSRSDSRNLVAFPDRYGLSVRGRPIDRFDGGPSLSTGQIMLPKAFQPGGVPEVVISCTSEFIPDDHPQYSPGCRMLFAVHPLRAYVSIAFRRTDLEQWLDMKAQVEALLLGFAVSRN